MLLFDKDASVSYGVVLMHAWAVDVQIPAFQESVRDLGFFDWLLEHDGLACCCCMCFDHSNSSNRDHAIADE